MTVSRFLQEQFNGGDADMDSSRRRLSARISSKV